MGHRRPDLTNIIWRDRDGSIVRVGPPSPATRRQRVLARLPARFRTWPRFLAGDVPGWLAATYALLLVFGPSLLALAWGTDAWAKGNALEHYAELRIPALGVLAVLVVLAAVDSTVGRSHIRRARTRAFTDRDEARERELNAKKAIADRERRLRAMRRYLHHTIKESMQEFGLGPDDRVSVYSCCHRGAGGYDFEIHVAYSQREHLQNMDWIPVPLESILEYVASSKRKFLHSIESKHKKPDGSEAYWDAWANELRGVIDIEADESDIYPLTIVAIPIEEYDETIGVVMFETSGTVRAGNARKRAKPKIEVGLDKIRKQIKSGLVDLHRYRSEANEVE